MKADIGTYPKDRQVLYKVIPLDTPLALDLHITHSCNFRCNYCILSASDEEFRNSGLPRGTMSWETFCMVVDQIKEFSRPLKLVAMSGIGEATIHPRLVDMVRALHDSGMVKTVQLITNAARLNKEMSEQLVEAGLGELRVSLQGLTSKKYKEIAGVDLNWDELYDNLVYFSKIKKNCALKVKVVDTALEPGEEEKFYSLFGDICDAVAVEHVYDAWAVIGYNLDLGESDDTITRYGDKKRIVKVCPRVFTRLDVLPDGSLTQFCHTRFGHEKNIKDMTLKELWTSKEQNQLRADMLNGKIDTFEQCRRCTFITNTWHDEDIIDGHEKEVLERMEQLGALKGTSYDKLG